MVLQKIAENNMDGQNEVLRRIEEDEMCMYRSIHKKKMAFTWQVLRELLDSNGEDALQILEGKFEATTSQGRPRRMWLDDIKHWTKLYTYVKIN